MKSAVETRLRFRADDSHVKHISARQPQKTKNPHGLCDWLIDQNPFVLHTPPDRDKLTAVSERDTTLTSAEFFRVRLGRSHWPCVNRNHKPAGLRLLT